MLKILKSRKKRKYIITASISVLLTAAIICASYVTIFGEVYAYASKYISETQVFSADTLENAIKKCQNAGFTAVKKNINRTEDGDDDDDGIYIVGYKTTDNPEEGITGISMLQMNSGYQDYTYRDIAERAVEKLGNIPAELKKAIDEFTGKYKQGSPAAVSAVKVLNCYSIDEMDNRKLGDYFVSGECTTDFIKMLFARSSTAVITAVCNALVAGVADYGNDDWASRLCASDEIQKLLEDDENYSRLDLIYKIPALELVDSLQSFSTSFHDAEARYQENNKKVEIPETEEKSITEIPEETADDIANGGEIQEEDGDAFILFAYDLLNQYNFNETTKLGDYIVSLGDSSYEENQNLRKLYPLVSALSKGQLATMRLSGVALSAIYLINEDGMTVKAEEQVSEIIKDVKSQIGKDAISIWTGTDQSIYNQKVAVTTEAYRANSAGQIYNTLTTPDDVDDFLSSAMSKLQIIMSVVGVAYGVTQLVGSTIAYLSAFAIGSLGTTASVWAVCCAGIGSSVLGSIFGVLGCTIIILNYVAIVAMLVLLAALLIKWIWDMCHDDDKEDFTPIPSIMFDSANRRYVKYEAVKNGGSPANINGKNAKRWNALYTTKSEYVGDPICSSEIDDLIVIQYDNNSTPIGYTPVTCFGEVTVANLNANTDEDNPNIFMYTKTTVNEINEGEKQTGNLYLSKISLSTESSETAAKAALTKTGMKVLDINLTPVTDSVKKYTYLGFKTTTNADDAITDIRVSPRNSADVFMFGNASYTACGTTPVGDTLYYTSYASAGVPILADIQVKASLKDAPEGYEPVNMFCGGNAYNLNMGSELGYILAPSTGQSYEHWKDKGSYLFFKPSVTFTEGTEYISGIVAVAGMNMKSGGNSAINYCNDLGLKNLDADLTYGWKSYTYYRTMNYEEYVYWKNVNTILCYSTTHNPYRAIYGIRSYTAAPNNSTLNSSMGSMTNGAYAVCDILYQLPDTCGSKPAESEMNRGVYQSHSYQFVTECGASCGLRDVSGIIKICPEDDETVDWEYSGCRGKGLYVLGPTDGGTPLTLDDIQISDKAETPEGFVSVQDFKNPNRTEPHNLAYNGYSSEYQCKKPVTLYIYVRQEKPVEKQYISSISVVSFSLDKLTGGKTDSLDDKTKLALQKTCNDYCIQSLISSCPDEIIPANLAVDHSESFYAKYNTKTYRASYIGVTRTDVESKAITGIIRFVTKSNNPETTIDVNGVTYKIAGDKINDPKGSYYLYYTNSAGANPGMPITSIDVSSDVFISDAATAMSASTTDVAEKKIGTEVISDAELAPIYGDANSSVFIHMYHTDTATYMGGIYVGHGKTRKEAQCNLLTIGCNMCIDMDLNKNTNGEYVYIGYTRYTLFGSELKKGVPKYAVRDILLTIGEEHQQSFNIGKVKYKSATDDYNYNGVTEDTRGVSLNAGTGGKQIYLYYTTTQTAETSDPISRLGASCRDFSILDTNGIKWEHILDKNGNRVNVNEGAVGTTDEGLHIIDNRIYLYASRYNNTVKEKSAVDPGIFNNEYLSYDVYMKGA